MTKWGVFWDGCDAVLRSSQRSEAPDDRVVCGSELRYETLTPRTFAILSKMSERLSEYASVGLGAVKKALEQASHEPTGQSSQTS